MKQDYLERILSARVYDVAIESPLEMAPALSARLNNTLLLKREDMQPVFSFKLRGAYNKMIRLTSAELKRGVITSSAGNHAQGVALAAQKIGCAATIVMPVTTPHIKVSAVAATGAQVVLHGDAYSDAYDKAMALAQRRRLTFVHPFDDPDVIAGQGTIGMEIMRQWSGPLHAIFVAVGGGGLIGGIAAFVKRLRPDIRIIGVEPIDADAMTRSLAAGRRIILPHVGLFADGVAVKQVGRETFRLARELVDEMIVVDTDSICAAIKDVFEDTRAILEPAGALAIAGAKAYVERSGVHGENLVAVACGANMNFDRLRFVAERAELGERREAILPSRFPNGPAVSNIFAQCWALEVSPSSTIATPIRGRLMYSSAYRYVTGARLSSWCKDCGASACRRRIFQTMKWPSYMCVTWSEGALRTSSTNSCSASSSRNGQAR